MSQINLQDLSIKENEVSLGELGMGVEKSGEFAHEVDPTVPAWAKKPTKPEYDYSEIKNTPDLNKYAEKETLKDYVKTEELNAVSEEVGAIDSKADEAKETADGAKETADRAKQAADEAKGTGNNAQEVATEALKTANLAHEEANEATRTAENAVVIAGENNDNIANLNAEVNDLKNALPEYAKKTEVKEEISALINSAPETLDTLGEIAKAIEDNEEVVDLLNQAIGEKASQSDLQEVSGAANNAHNEALTAGAKATNADIKAEQALTKANQAETNANNYTDEKVQLAYVTIGREANLYTDEKIGDIETALDELHNYAQNLISGGAS